MRKPPSPDKAREDSRPTKRRDAPSNERGARHVKVGRTDQLYSGMGRLRSGEAKPRKEGKAKEGKRRKK